MGIFGWSLPPGVSMRDIDPPDYPCEVCGLEAGSCECPECPVCDEAGNPECYERHGLTLTDEQRASKAHADAERMREVEAENAFWAQFHEQ